MAKKDEVKKIASKASKPAIAKKTEVAEAKAPAKAQKIPARASLKVETTFRLEAPQASQVLIVGCFNDWDLTANPLEQDAEGTWSCTLVLEPGEHEYRFIVDEVWWNDPANMLLRWNEFGTQNCILIVQD